MRILSGCDSRAPGRLHKWPLKLRGAEAAAHGASAEGGWVAYPVPPSPRRSAVRNERLTPARGRPQNRSQVFRNADAGHIIAVKGKGVRGSRGSTAVVGLAPYQALKRRCSSGHTGNWQTPEPCSPLGYSGPRGRAQNVHSRALLDNYHLSRPLRQEPRKDAHHEAVLVTRGERRGGPKRTQGPSERPSQASPCSWGLPHPAPAPSAPA